MTTKVFIDTPMFAIGGVESFSINLAKSFQKQKDYDVYLIESRSNRYINHKISEESVKEINKQVPIIKTEEYFEIIENTNQRTVTLTSWNRDFTERLSKMLSASSFSKEKHKVIGYVHNEASPYYDTMLLYESIFDAIVCVSKPSFEFLKKTLPHLSDKLYFRACPTSININSFKEKKYSGQKEKLVLTFVGRLEDTHKGIFRIPKILKMLKEQKVDFFIKIIGDGPDKVTLEEQLKDFKGLYSFHLAHNQLEIKTLVEDVDVILLTSNFEGGPLVIYEAMACGVIPIVNRVGNMPNLIKHRENGYIFSIGDNEGFINSIEELYNDRKVLSKIGEEAYNTIKSSGYLQKDYTAFLMGIVENSWTKPYYESTEIKSDIESKKNDKLIDISRWVDKTIPTDILNRYWIKEYLKLAKGAGGIDNKQLNFYIKKDNETREHYDTVYEQMPKWWKKIGSVIRKINSK